MACHGGSQQVVYSENTVSMEHCCFEISPSPAMFAVDLERGGRDTSQEHATVHQRVHHLLQVLDERTKKEGKLVQELKLRMAKEESLVQDLKIAQRREEHLWQNYSANKMRQDEILKDLDIRKNREEELLQRVGRLEQDKEIYASMCNKAIKNCQLVQAEIEAADQKLEKYEKGQKVMKADLALVKSQAAQQSQDEAMVLSLKEYEIVALQSQLAKMKQQLQGGELLLSQKDSTIVALQSQLAKMEDDKEKQLVKVADLDAMSKELVCSINSIQLFLNVHVSALTVNVQEFLTILLSHGNTNAPLCELGNKHDDECPFSQTKPHGEQDIAEYQELPSLESSARNLVKAINCAKYALFQAAKYWNETRTQETQFQARKYLLNLILGKEFSSTNFR